MRSPRKCTWREEEKTQTEPWTGQLQGFREEWQDTAEETKQVDTSPEGSQLERLC